MLKRSIMALFIVSTTLAQVAVSQDASLDSQWVIMGNDGKLKYKTTPRGDRIMDYSHAGYMGGGVAIPTVPAKITLSPQPNGDDTARIQAAIDQVSKMPLVGNFRGAVLLKPGNYRCAKQLTIKASGVVLRGSGKGNNGTVISMTGEPHTCVVLAGEKINLKLGKPTNITDKYVPSGTDKISVESTFGLSVGDKVRIQRTITKEWIALLEMDKLVRDGKQQTWINPGTKLSFERIITGIKGNVLTLNTGLSDSIDSQFTKTDPATVQKIELFERSSHLGVEDLRIVSNPPEGDLTVPKFGAVQIGAIEDSWVRNISSHDPVGVIGFTWDAYNSTRVTIQFVDAYHSKPIARGAGYPADVNILGSFYLIDRFKVDSNSKGFFYASLGTAETAAVVLNCTTKGNASIQPHMRWNTGLLVDSCKVPDAGIEFVNRKTGGSGHGWCIGWPVAWNCTAGSFDNKQAPGTVAWMIGCKGEISKRKGRRYNLHNGIYASHGTHVDPSSLYLAQLRERLGESALKNIGY